MVTLGHRGRPVWVGNALGGTILMGVTAFNTLIFWLVLPRSYEIRSDRLRIVLGWPFAVNIPFNTIAEIRAARASGRPGIQRVEICPIHQDPGGSQKEQGPEHGYQPSRPSGVHGESPSGAIPLSGAAGHPRLKSLRHLVPHLRSAYGHVPTSPAMSGVRQPSVSTCPTARSTAAASSVRPSE